jgi:hypothetical protein
MVQHLNAAVVRETFDERAPEIRCVRRRRQRLFRKVEVVQHLIVQLGTARQAMPFHPTWLTRARRDHTAGNRALSSAEGTELWLVRSLSYKPENRCAERSL